MANREDVQVLAERILNATVVIDDRAHNFEYAEFRKKVMYVLGLHPTPLVMTTIQRNRLKNHLVGELVIRDIPFEFYERLDTMPNLRRTGGKRRKKTKRKLK